MIIRNQNPKGGTELQLEYLRKHVDLQVFLIKYKYVHQFQKKLPLHETKVNILWQKNSWDQPNIIDWFQR